MLSGLCSGHRGSKFLGHGHITLPAQVGTGPEFVGLGPLHEETHASFRINAQKSLFYCHGCAVNCKAVENDCMPITASPPGRVSDVVSAIRCPVTALFPVFPVTSVSFQRIFGARAGIAWTGQLIVGKPAL